MTAKHLIVIAAVWSFSQARIAGQTNCSNISGSIQAAPGSPTCSASGEKANTQITVTYNCTAICNMWPCKDVNNKSVLQTYPANIPSGTIAPTGQCGTTDSSGKEIPGAKNCPPDAPVQGGSSPEVSPPGTLNTLQYDALARTQAQDLQSCLPGNHYTFNAQCAAVSCQAPCSTVCQGQH
jgi:hypothetical protein